MPRLQREHLETLLVAVDHGTLDAAARALAITPSAVSQRIKSMEQQVGRVLLQRTTPVRPTADGEVVLRHARQAQLLDQETARALGGGDSIVPSIPLAVNADSLGTWFLDALALVRADTEVVFDLHREDQDRTAELLRAGTVMGAVTAEADPVQGCSSVPLGIDRYRAVASPAFVDRYLGVAAGAGSERRLLDRMDRVPLVDYDRADDLQQGYLRRVLGNAPSGPRHFVPTSADFARAVSLGFGWGMLPEAQCLDALDRGDLVELTPGRRADVALWWQRWNLASPLLERVTDAVRATAAERLHPVRPAVPRERRLPARVPGVGLAERCAGVDPGRAPAAGGGLRIGDHAVVPARVGHDADVTGCLPSAVPLVPPDGEAGVGDAEEQGHSESERSGPGAAAGEC